MSKRSIQILANMVLLLLIIGIIAYFVFPPFQGWTQVWLGRPDGLAASATTMAAIATLIAVVVGLWGIRVGQELARDARREGERQFHDAQRQTQEALEEGRRQFLEAQYNASRPLLVPATADTSDAGYQYLGEEPIKMEWDIYQFVTIRNVGPGIATNVWATLMPPAPMPDMRSQYVSRIGTPLSGETDPMKLYFLAGASAFDESDKIGGYGLCAPVYTKPEGEAFESRGIKDYAIARLCLTYQDIFDRKHASIFDLTERGVWLTVALLTNIEQDLSQLDASKGKASINARIAVS